MQLIDEAGGAAKQVEELRNAFERDHVDAVMGYVSSGDCLAVSPAAEDLKRLLILLECGTPRIFEENKFKYVFRTAAHGAMDNVAMARYLVKRGIKVTDVGAINQDYAWGRTGGRTSRAVSPSWSRKRRRKSSSGRSSARASTARKSRPCCRKIRA